MLLRTLLKKNPLEKARKRGKRKFIHYFQKVVSPSAASPSWSGKRPKDRKRGKKSKFYTLAKSQQKNHSMH